MAADCRHSSSRGSRSHRCPKEVKVWKELGCTRVSWRFAFKVVKELERAYNTRTKNQDEQSGERGLLTPQREGPRQGKQGRGLSVGSWVGDVRDFGQGGLNFLFEVEGKARCRQIVGGCSWKGV